MALKNTSGNYLKITRINGNILENNKTSISYKLWESEELRNAPTEFTKTVEEFIRVNDSIITEIHDSELSIRNNIIIKAYLYLKSNGFENWENC